MFDLAWSELALIAVVAVVVIGPKDLPDAVRGIARGVQKLRRMAGQFQGQLDEVVKDANLQEVRDSINTIRNFDFKGEIEKHVDADGSLRKTMAEDPIRDADPFKPAMDAAAPAVDTAPPVTPPDVVAAAPEAPAFIPPEIAAAQAPAAPAPLPPIPEVALPEVPPPPAFLPPGEVEKTLAAETPPGTQPDPKPTTQS